MAIKKKLEINRKFKGVTSWARQVVNSMGKKQEMRSGVE